MRIKGTTFLCYFLCIVMLLTICVFMKSTSAVLMFVTYVLILGSTFQHPSKHVYFILFLISFFVFLLGKPMIIEFGGEDTGAYAALVPREVVQYTYGTITVSLLSVFAGYSLLSCLLSINNNRQLFLKEVSGGTVSSICRVTRCTTVFLGFIQLLDVIEKVVYVLRYGYMESYLSHSSILPGFVSQLADVYQVSFAMYLAALPDKNDAKLPITMHLIVMLLHLLTGKRYESVSAVFLVVLYFIMRSKTDTEPWIKRKHIIALLLIVPFLMGFLTLITSWRLGESNDKGFIDLISGFFTGVGGSSILISFERMFHADLKARDVLFSLGNLWSSFSNNALGRMLGLGTSYANQTIEKALYGHSLGSAIMYMVNPKRFLSGGGLGSCYIAELMSDFSYGGLILGSAFIGCVIRRLSGLSKNNYVRNYLVIFTATYMFRIPRDSFDFFFYQLFGIKNVLFFVCVILLSKSKQCSIYHR